MLHEPLQKPMPWLRNRIKLLNLSSPLQKHVSFETEYIQGVACEWCRPQPLIKPERMVIYYHGGGYVLGALEAHRNTIARIAIEAEAWVVAVDYRLGPEHIFPAAQDDCLAVCLHLFERYATTAISLTGDLAGGALCVATALTLAKQNPALTLTNLALISPWVEPGDHSASSQQNSTHDILEPRILQRWSQLYIGDTNLQDTLVDFSQCKLSVLPALYIQAAGSEILIDQIKRFVARARQQGVVVQFDVFADQFHIFQIFTPLLPDSKRAITQVANFIKTCQSPSILPTSD